MKKVAVLLLALAFIISVVTPSAFAAEAQGAQPGESTRGRPDNRTPNPLKEKQFELRQKGQQKKIAGQVKGKVAEVAKGQFVELAREGTDRAFTILVDFGGADGPVSGQIPQPDRTKDNTTYAPTDVSPQHYRDMLYSQQPGVNSVANYFLEQSSGRYTIDGVVTDWVRVKASEWEYGRNEGVNGGPAPEDTVYRIAGDAVAQWTVDQKARGWSDQQIKDYLKQFDTLDRYDYDGDGNFNEPDGYIDRFLIVHAGEGEEAGGGAQGSDAIWSHSWYANWPTIGTGGPANNKAGGYEFPGTGFWVGDYTIMPENGGVGVFTHEFAHDLNLPDEYDQTYTGTASSAFWSLMSSGSWLSDSPTDIGTKPGHLSAYGKLQLGWLNYEVASAGQKSVFRVGPAETNTKQAQAVITVLPKRERTITINTPFAGSYEWYSGMGDDLNNTLARSIDLTGKTAASLSAKAWYQIEAGYDYLYAEVSTDGTNWTVIPGAINGKAIGNDGGGKPGISGSSRGAWVDLAYDLSQFAGKTIQFRFRYYTDGGVALKGFAADNISITADGAPIFSDDVESGNNGWTAKGFSRFQGSTTALYNNYYIAEFRQYRGYDNSLKAGPYNFVTDTWAERFPYQDGLLISYWDTFYKDNQVGVHPGEGLILPIDARPQPLLAADGKPAGTRIQVYDATFGLEPTDAIALTVRGTKTTFPSQPAVSTFNDLNTYWYASKPDAGVKVPQTGTTIQIVNYNAQGNFMDIQVRPAK